MSVVLQVAHDEDAPESSSETLMARIHTVVSAFVSETTAERWAIDQEREALDREKMEVEQRRLELIQEDKQRRVKLDLERLEVERRRLELDQEDEQRRLEKHRQNLENNEELVRRCAEIDT